MQIGDANAQAIQRVLGATPVLVGVGRARAAGADAVVA